MPLKLAFIGFQHGHILSLYQLARQLDAVEVVAACEEDDTVRQALVREGRVEITHAQGEEMLDQVGCDAVAVGDYFGRRGHWAIAALSRGKHLIGDKPLCTSLTELDQMEALARGSGLRVGCMLDFRDCAQVQGVRQLIRSGRIGPIHAVAFGGQHPLLAGSRPAWYFEPGKHGGTLNDIGIHALDAIPWITGLRFRTIEAARSWNAFVPQFPWFADAGQMMLTMENGCGVLGDVSYFAPDRMGYRMPLYWRTTFWGRDGVAEVSMGADCITVIGADDEEAGREPLPPGRPGGYLQDFLDDLAGRSHEGQLDTRSVLAASRLALEVQQAANLGRRGVPVNGE
jgi:predicted dehydrogenase